MSNFKLNVIDNYESLTEREKIILSYLIQFPKKYEIKELSQKFNTSQALISKLCKKINYDNYKEMMYDLKKNNHNSVKNEKPNDDFDIEKIFLKQKQFNWNETKISELSDLLFNFPIVMFGVGPNYFLLKDFSYRMSAFGKKLDVCSNINDVERSIYCYDNPILVVLSYRGKNILYQRWLELFNKHKNLRVVLITAEKTSNYQYKNVDLLIEIPHLKTYSNLSSPSEMLYSIYLFEKLKQIYIKSNFDDIIKTWKITKNIEKIK